MIKLKISYQISIFQELRRGFIGANNFLCLYSLRCFNWLVCIVCFNEILINFSVRHKLMVLKPLFLTITVHYCAEISLIWLVKWSAIKLLILYVTRKKPNLKPREISMLTLYWKAFPRYLLGFYFLISKKENNIVNLRQ